MQLVNGDALYEMIRQIRKDMELYYPQDPRRALDDFAYRVIRAIDEAAISDEQWRALQYEAY